MRHQLFFTFKFGQEARRTIVHEEQYELYIRETSRRILASTNFWIL